MARDINPGQLAKTIQSLQQKRAEYQRKIAEIDEVFARCGITPGSGAAPARAARPAAAPAKRRGKRRRGRFAKSAGQSLIDLVRSAGKKGVSSNELAKHWKTEGRAGQPYVALGQLVRTKKLRKENLKGQRGSQYFAA